MVVCFLFLCLFFFPSPSPPTTIPIFTSPVMPNNVYNTIGGGGWSPLTTNQFLSNSLFDRENFQVNGQTTSTRHIISSHFRIFRHVAAAGTKHAGFALIYWAFARAAATIFVRTMADCCTIAGAFPLATVRPCCWPREKDDKFNRKRQVLIC